jgi:hypothetical protein
MSLGDQFSDSKGRRGSHAPHAEGRKTGGWYSTDEESARDSHRRRGRQRRDRHLERVQTLGTDVAMRAGRANLLSRNEWVEDRCLVVLVTIGRSCHNWNSKGGSDHGTCNEECKAVGAGLDR